MKRSHRLKQKDQDAAEEPMGKMAGAGCRVEGGGEEPLPASWLQED